MWRTVVESLFPWGVLATFGVVLLAFKRDMPDRIASLVKPFGSIKFFGAELVMTEDNARKIQKSASDTFRDYRDSVRSEYDRLAATYDVRSRLEEVYRAAGGAAGGPALRDVGTVRMTIHVPDALFDDRLYQLIDYYPGGGGRGRTFSARFGIIGIAWRARSSQLMESVPVEEMRLIKEWGMTREEAANAGQGRQSFCCVVLKDQESSVGMLYIDAKDRGAFGALAAAAESAFLFSVASLCDEHGLVRALREINADLRKRVPLISAP